MKPLRAVLCCALFALSACRTSSIDALAQRWLTDDERALPPMFVTLLRDGEFASAKRWVLGSTLRQVPDSVWETISTTLQGLQVDSLEAVGLTVNTAGEGLRTVSQTFEVKGPESWLVIGLVSQAGLVARFNVETNDVSLRERFALTNAPLRPAHAYILFWAISAWGAAIAASWRAIRAKMPGRWLWVPLSFVMVGRLTLNWTTAAASFFPLTVFVPPLTWAKSGPAAPWLFGVGIPLFAMITWRKAARWEAAPVAADPVSQVDYSTTWTVFRSTTDGGQFRIAAYNSEAAAQSHLERLQSAGLEHTFWIERGD